MESPRNPPPSGQWAYPTDEKGEPKKKYVLWVVLGAAGCFGSVVVLGLLATLIVPRIVKKYTYAAQEMARAQLLDLRSALEVYAETHGGRYPDALEELVLPDRDGHTLLRDERELPRDPWGRAYVYQPPAAGQSEPLLRTLGRDGQPGGTGLDADLQAGPQAGEDR